MAFTNYIVQSFVFAWIFFGYGLGQFGRMGVSTAFLLGITLYDAQMVASALWLRWFRFGPLEWLWRSLMYGRPQVMLKSRFRSIELSGMATIESSSAQYNMRRCNVGNAAR